MYCCVAGFLFASSLTSEARGTDLNTLSPRTFDATSLIFSKFTRPSTNVSFPMCRKYASFVTSGMKGITGGASRL